MKNVVRYLTDAELESLIREVEQTDLVSAPLDLQERILEVLNAPEESRKQEKIRAYRRFRFQVLTTVAAAVLMLLLLPKLESVGVEGLQWENVDFSNVQWEEKSVHQPQYETREEALNDRGVLETLLGGVNIFAENNKWNLFRE